MKELNCTRSIGNGERVVPRQFGGLLVALLLVLAACGGDTTETTQQTPGDTSPTATVSDGNGIDTTTAATDPVTDEQVEITMWFGRDGFIPDGGFDDFHDRYPNIRVNAEVIPFEEAIAEFIRSAGSDFAPDIFQTFNDTVGVLVANDQLRDMSDMIERFQEEDPDLYGELQPVTWGGASWQGVPYGFNLHPFPEFFGYRSDLYGELGLEDPPQTWDEVLDASRAMVEAEGSSFVGFSTVGCRENDPITWFTGPGYAMGMEDVDGVPLLTSEGGLYFLSFFQTLVREGLTSPDVLSWCSDEMRAAFYDGRAGHIFASMGENIRHPNYGEQSAMIAPPLQRCAECPQDGRFVGRGGPYYVSAATEHPYEVSLVLRYLAEPENLLSIHRRYTESSNTAVNAEMAGEQPWLTDLVDDADLVVELPAHERQLELSEVMKDVLQHVLANPNEDVAEIADRFQQELDRVAGG